MGRWLDSDIFPLFPPSITLLFFLTTSICAYVFDGVYVCVCVCCACVCVNKINMHEHLLWQYLPAVLLNLGRWTLKVLLFKYTAPITFSFFFTEIIFLFFLLNFSLHQLLAPEYILSIEALFWQSSVQCSSQYEALLYMDVKQLLRGFSELTLATNFLFSSTYTVSFFELRGLKSLLNWKWLYDTFALPNVPPMTNATAKLPTLTLNLISTKLKS